MASFVHTPTHRLVVVSVINGTQRTHTSYHSTAESASAIAALLAYAPHVAKVVVADLVSGEEMVLVGPIGEMDAASSLDR